MVQCSRDIPQYTASSSWSTVKHSGVNCMYHSRYVVLLVLVTAVFMFHENYYCP